MRVDASHPAPWSRVADHGQKVGWRGEALPPGQARKQAVEPAPVEPAPVDPAPAPEAPVAGRVDVLA